MLSKSTAKYINKLANELRRKTDTYSFSKEYSGAQWKALHFILSKEGDIFQRDIEREFRIRSSTATELVKQLEHNGFIRKEPVSYDSRLRKIVVMDKAKAFQEKVDTELKELDGILTQGIPADKLNIYYEVMEMMISNLSK